MSLCLGLLISFSAAAAAGTCPNLSGSFYNEETETNYSIEQQGCDLIRYIYDEGAIEVLADGKEALISSYEIVVEEGKVLATVKIFETNEFNGNNLITNERSVVVYASGDVEQDAVSSVSYLDQNLDLVTASHGSNGDETTIDKRVK